MADGGDIRAGQSIREFSQITHLSVKTLRRYHEAGLLQAAEVDPHTGNRYYATTQVPTAQVIRRYRELGMPVREVREVLATTDPQARSALIAAHLERLENQLGRTQAAVTSLRRLLQPASPPIKIELRTAEAITTATIRATVDHSELPSPGTARPWPNSTRRSGPRTSRRPGPAADCTTRRLGSLPARWA